MVRRVAYYRQFERDNTRRIRYIPFAVINTSSLVQISNYLGFILCEYMPTRILRTNLLEYLY